MQMRILKERVAIKIKCFGWMDARYECEKERKWRVEAIEQRIEINRIEKSGRFSERLWLCWDLEGGGCGGFFLLTLFFLKCCVWQRKSSRKCSGQLNVLSAHWSFVVGRVEVTCRISSNISFDLVGLFILSSPLDCCLFDARWPVALNATF